MAFQISELTRNTQASSTTYFLDANVWLYAIQNSNSLNQQLNRYEQLYAEFFNDIFDSNLDPQPKIIMTGILFSEIVNSYLKKVAMKNYITKFNKPDELDYKREYRPTSHYLTSYQQIVDDIYSYQECFEYISDRPILQDEPSIKSISSNFDFNDHFYIHLCKKHIKDGNELLFVTNDSDFIVEDLPILTNNRNLLALR